MVLDSLRFTFRPEGHQACSLVKARHPTALIPYIHTYQVHHTQSPLESSLATLEEGGLLRNGQQLEGQVLFIKRVWVFS